MSSGAPQSPGAQARPGEAEPPTAVLLGEVHTGLLQSSTPVTPGVVRGLLELVPRAPVRMWERPVRHATSPACLPGVDALLPSRSDTHTRAVGTVVTEASVTAGHVLAVSSYGRVVPAQHRRRLPWSHYLTRPGVIEAWGEPRIDDLVSGFLQPELPPAVLNLGGIGSHVMGLLQRSPLVDRRPPFRVPRTTVRWAATEAPSGSTARVELVVEAPFLRTLHITGLSPEAGGGVNELCQDIALHDWLISSVVSLVDVAHIGGRERRLVLEHLSPAVDHLLHMWMPAARLPPDLQAFWAEVARHAGLDRQWGTVVRRIRDQVALASAEMAIGRPRPENPQDPVSTRPSGVNRRKRK